MKTQDTFKVRFVARNLVLGGLAAGAVWLWPGRARAETGGDGWVQRATNSALDGQRNDRLGRRF